MLITAESLEKILNTNTYFFETVLLYVTLLSLCLERVFVLFHENCTENLKWYHDKKNHFYFFFGFRNVYETHPMRNFRP